MQDLSYTDRSSIPIVHLEIVRESEMKYSATQLSNGYEVADLFEQLIGNRNTENMLVCAVDCMSRPVFLQIIGTGAVNTCQFSVSDIWKGALMSNATAVIVAHNHPSGYLSPSGEDIAVTRNLLDAGKMLGIQLLDHLIVNGNDYYSFHSDMPELWQ